MATQTKDDKPSATAVSKSSSTPVVSPPGSSVLVGDDGRTVVHNQVVAKIVGLAVQEIGGVHRLVPYDTSQSITAFANKLSRSTTMDLGVRVEVGTTEAAVDLRIVAEYGASIPQVADAIRQNITDRVRTMTGLKVVEVNIDVVDLYFPDGDEEGEPVAATVPEPSRVS